MNIYSSAKPVSPGNTSVSEGAHYEEFVRAYAQRALMAAADASAHAISVKLPAPSRAANQRAYRRELQIRFEAAVREVNRAWTKSLEE